MLRGSRVLACALGLATVAGLVGVGCSRTDPLDYPQIGAFDAGRRDARPDVGHDTGPPDVVTDLGPPDRGPPDVAPDVPKGCTSDSQCSDGLACTVDHCDLATGLCSHVPDDSLCPVGDACFAMKGCYPGAFANDFGNLFGVVPPTGAVTSIGSTGSNKFDDIALSPAGTLYGVTDGMLFTIDTTTAATVIVASVDRALVGLDFGSDGTLYGASGSTNEVYTLDPGTGILTVLANLPGAYFCSGDVAVLGTTLYITAQTTPPPPTPPSPDVLMAIDLAGAPSVTTVGSTGYPCIFGLAAYEGVLYGFTCQGDVLTIDTTTGAATVIAKNPGDTFYGATAR